ncbi:MAG: hypothetical protein JW881_03785 [Spirochaetales bacterium]|nr:hypothetical protein [Spirochaetales bacterium]
MLLAAVFLLSLSSLSFEVLLARFFSISQWNNLSFMVISIALMGFAASGIFLNLVSFRRPGFEHGFAEKKWIRRFVLLFFLSASGSYLAANAIPLDYFRLPFDPFETVRLILTFLLLSFPFFFAGLLTALAYVCNPERPGFVYFLSMLGSMCGAILPVFLLPLFGPGGCIVISAFIPVLLLFYTDMKPLPAVLKFSACFVVLVFLLTWDGGGLTEAAPSAYKTLPQLLKQPGTRVVETHHSIRGRIDVVESPSIRFAPGLSLKYGLPMPGQRVVIRDADEKLVLYDIDPDDPPDLPAYTLPFCGYTLHRKPENILVIQRGGGIGLLSALRSRASRITVVEEHPWIAAYVDDFYKSGRIRVAGESCRVHLARVKETYDIIQVEDWGTSIPAMASLNEQYLLTVEAFTQYIDHLEPDGILVVARKLLIPPSDSLRVAATAYEALEREGIASPLKHIILLKSWDIYALFLSPSPFSEERIGRMKAFCDSMNFDVLFYDGMDPAEADRYVKSAARAHTITLHNLLGGKKAMACFFGNYYLSVSPSTDNKPFQSNFIRWDRIFDLYDSTGERSYAILLSGELIVWVVFFTALFIGFFLLVLPVVIVPKKRYAYRPLPLLYFLGVGAGFMFIEMAFIKTYTFLTGESVLAFSFVLCLVLVFSGIGGFLSSRVERKTLRLLLVVLIGIVLILFVLINHINRFIIGLHPFFRYCCMGVLILPVSIFMGVPFPVGMRLITDHPMGRVYGWAANGSASVLSSIIAVPTAMGAGIDTLFICAGIAYGITLFAFVMTDIKKKPV